MQYLVLFIAIAVLGVALVVGFRPRTVAAERLDSAPPILGLSEPDPVLPPVLLPEHPRGEDVQALRLSPALRGYRCDQVDAVLDALGDELDRLRALVPAAPEPLGDAGVEPGARAGVEPAPGAAPAAVPATPDVSEDTEEQAQNGPTPGSGPGDTGVSEAAHEGR